MTDRNAVKTVFPSGTWEQEKEKNQFIFKTLFVRIRISKIKKNPDSDKSNKAKMQITVRRVPTERDC
jgi:hypothetical protein